MRRCSLILCAILACSMLFAKDIERVSITYEYVSNNPNETPAEAEQKAFEQAKQKALEDKFGLDVSSVTSTLIASRSGNGDTRSENNVFSIGETSVRGEWIETTKAQVLEKSFTKGFWVIKVRVEGRARNQATEKADIQYTFVRDIRDVESPVTFRDGSDIFLRFASPVAGHLCVYLVDEEQNAFCLLPYPHQQNGSQPVDANKDYLFFSTIYDRDAQEYTLNCERSSEQNAIYVIFSPNDFTKAADKQGGKNFRDEQLPRELSYEALLKWLSRNQTKDADMVVRRSVITIRK